MKKPYYTLIFFFIIASCSKSGGSGSETTVPITPVAPTTPVIPVITVPTQTVWQLKALSVGGIPHTLTPIQAAFEMTISNNGKYADTDGAIGTWSKPVPDSLVIAKTNLPTPITLRYRISRQTTTQLSLTSGSTGSQIDVIYEAQ